MGAVKTSMPPGVRLGQNPTSSPSGTVPETATSNPAGSGALDPKNSNTPYRRGESEPQSLRDVKR